MSLLRLNIENCSHSQYNAYQPLGIRAWIRRAASRSVLTSPLWLTREVAHAGSVSGRAARSRGASVHRAGIATDDPHDPSERTAVRMAGSTSFANQGFLANHARLRGDGCGNGK